MGPVYETSRIQLPREIPYVPLIPQCSRDCDIIPWLADVHKVILKHHPQWARDGPYVQHLYMLLHFDLLVVTVTQVPHVLSSWCEFTARTKLWCRASIGDERKTTNTYYHHCTGRLVPFCVVGVSHRPHPLLHSFRDGANTDIQYSEFQSQLYILFTATVMWPQYWNCEIWLCVRTYVRTYIRYVQ